jgi:hypothetical protein
VLNFFDDHLARDFVIIFDDCERDGEAEAANRCRRLLERRQISFFENTVKAAKQQRLFCTAKFKAAAYF